MTRAVRAFASNLRQTRTNAPRNLAEDRSVVVLVRALSSISHPARRFARPDAGAGDAALATRRLADPCPFARPGFCRAVSGDEAAPVPALTPAPSSYLLGSQERELHEAIERIVATGYGTVINVGAADGYYAVGLALRSPGTRVIAFEALAEMHPVIARVAALNRVGDRVAIFGACGIADLRRALAAAGPKTLVVMDIEGGEAKLLDPEARARAAPGGHPGRDARCLCSRGDRSLDRRDSSKPTLSSAMPRNRARSAIFRTAFCRSIKRRLPGLPSI